ncbi:MAG: transcriptional regulator, LysR family [Ramlibacter sp.]|nr:transcriptional regulator, LysR family [Ramlibacter sp.]
MELRQLSLFVAAAEEQHFTLAAKRENIVQSGLSVAIRALEDELGTLLFIRNKRQVQLSEAGRIFLPEAKRILEAVKTARAAVSDNRHAIAGRLAIGMVPSALSFLDLPALLQSFKARHPGVDLTLRETYPQVLAESLKKGLLDLALMPLHGVPMQGLEVVELYSTEMVLAVPEDHPMASRPSISVAELAHESFVEFSPRWGTRGLVDHILRKEGMARNIICEVENFDLLSRLVMRGFGVAILPRKLLLPLPLRALTLTPGLHGGPIPDWKLGVVRARNDHPLPLNAASDVFQAMLETESRGRLPPEQPGERPGDVARDQRLGKQLVDVGLARERGDVRSDVAAHENDGDVGADPADLQGELRA